MTSYFRLCDCADSERKHEIYSGFKKDSNKPDEQIEREVFSLLHLSREMFCVTVMGVKQGLSLCMRHMQSGRLATMC
jgi:hypothetical protein